MSRYLKYDKIINKNMDDLYAMMKSKKDLTGYDKNINKFTSEKIIDDKGVNDEINSITKKILKYYVFCSYLFYNYSNINFVKNKLLLDKVITSEELVDVLNLLDTVITINKLVNIADKDKLISEIENNESYKQIIRYLDSIGGNFITKYLVGNTQDKNNNIVQTVIFKYYRNVYRRKVFDLMSFNKNDKFKFIEIIIPITEVIDYVSIENVLTAEEIHRGYVDDIFHLLTSYNMKYDEVLSNKTKINKLFESKYVFPIVNDFLRYHKVTEKYDNQFSSSKIKSYERSNVKDQTKIRYIITKVDKIKDLYSKKVKNNKKLEIDVQKLFYKPLEYRNAILYNELEEINIINKLRKQGKTAIESNEYYYDLLKLRNYSYVYFKDFEKYGYKISLDKTTSAVRYSSLLNLEKSKFKSNKNIELRVVPGGSKGRIIGLTFSNNFIANITPKNLNLFDKGEDMSNQISTLLKKYIINQKHKNKFFMFDIKKYNVELDNYEKRVNNSDNIKYILLNIYDQLLSITYDKILSEMNKHKTLTFYTYNQILDKYQANIIIPTDSKLKIALDNHFLTKIKLIEDLTDSSESNLYGIHGNVIKLPRIKYIDNSVPEIVIPYLKKDEDDIEFDNSNAFCQHIIDWINLKKLKSRQPNKHNDLLVKFIKKYSVINKNKQYICKSCKQLLDIQNYLTNPYTGGSEGIDIILTTSRPLNELKQYSKFNFAIKNMNELVKRIAQIMNITYYMGNEQIHKLRRHDVIKNTIDMLNIHNSLLKSEKLNKRQRESNAFKNYGVSTDYSNYFVFPLENNIFQFSTEDIDKFKKIKINNVITYIMFFMLLEINPSQLLSFEFNKYCNLFFYDKFGKQYFSNLYTRVNNSNDVRKISRYNVLCFIIYYFSCMIAKFKLWYTSDEKPNMINMQKSIIHTLVDLVNSIMEIYERKSKNFLYDVIGSKFSNMLNSYLDNSEILKIIRSKESNKMSIEKNKIKFFKSKIKSIPLDGKFHKNKDKSRKQCECTASTYTVKMKFEQRDVGKILKSDLNKFNEELKLSNYKKLASMYDETGTIRKFRLTAKEVNKLSINEIMKSVNNITKKEKVINMKKIKTEKNHHKENYDEIQKTVSGRTDLLYKFLNMLKKNIGSKMKINKKVYLVDTDRFYFDHDFLGNSIENPFYLSIDDPKVKIRFSEQLKTKVYVILDKSSNVSIYYNYYTFNLIGYKEANKNIVILTSLGKYLKYMPSIESMIKTFGFKKYFYTFKNTNEINDLYRDRLIFIKNLTRKINTSLNQIKNKYKSDNTNAIVNYYIDKINNISLNKYGKEVFNNWESYILVKKNQFDNNLDNKVKLNNETSIYILSEINESNNDLINYILQQVILLVDINNDKFTRSNILYLLLSIIINAYFDNFEQYMDVNMLKYEYILDFISCSDFMNSNTYTADEISNLTDEEKTARDNVRIDDDERSEAFDVSRDTEDEEDEILIEDPDTN